MKPETKQTLYRVRIACKPNPRHHLYWEVESSVLHMILPAPSGQEATNRAWILAQALNYEVNKGPFETFEVEDPLPPEASPTLRLQAFIARGNGLALDIYHQRINAESPEPAASFVS